MRKNREDEERYLGALERVTASWLTLEEVGLIQCVSKKWLAGVGSELVWLEQLGRRKLETPYAPCNLLVKTEKEKLLFNDDADDEQKILSARLKLHHYVADESRNKIKLNELVGLEWNFRFKEAAGESWTTFDPYWQGKPATSVRFYSDGTTSRNSSCRKSAEEEVTQPSSFLDGVHVEWRWGDGDGRRASGTWPNSKIRARVDGQDVPTYIISRHPKHKGFIMQSCWVLYTAFPMPPKGTDPYLEDDALQVGWVDQAREALAYNTAQRVTNGFLDLSAFDTFLRGGAHFDPDNPAADLIVRFLLEQSVYQDDDPNPDNPLLGGPISAHSDDEDHHEIVNPS
uniref:Uncharacterized protein n=1 Tax=Aureoumbra lagunensis TaxID=44058 RepID=A0A7S3JQG3_9STRA|mmetsp:Transcript_17139/g.22249  ORF Transcript_17139/g.22249 Transcript_17139/m.22249 type:complete len:342 (+) Transcript_17139:112-1137(+)